MAFDESFGVDNIWITEDYFYTLNSQCRTDFLATLVFHCDLENEALDLETLAKFGPAKKKQLRETMNQRSLCHHCQKLVPSSEVVICGKMCRKGSQKKVSSGMTSRLAVPRSKLLRLASCATSLRSKKRAAHGSSANFVSSITTKRRSLTCLASLRVQSAG